jgi:hypothetical protein
MDKLRPSHHQAATHPYAKHLGDLQSLEWLVWKSHGFDKAWRLLAKLMLSLFGDIKKFKVLFRLIGAKKTHHTPVMGTYL